jgi:DNA-binding response OmpR family regulator
MVSNRTVDRIQGRIGIMRILVIEDYEPLRRSIMRGLREAGYAVDCAADGEEGLSYLQSSVYDVIVLDLMLPEIDGLTLLERLRAGESTSRVLVLTAKDGIDDRVRGLDMGADDYLVKPFAFEELMARVRALQRRRYSQTSPTIKVGDLEINTNARIVRFLGIPVELTAREYSILEVLAVRRGQVVTRDEIWDRIYDFAAERNSNVVDVYVGYLRKKLSRAGAPTLIRTKRGIGYMLGEDSR